MSSKYAPLASEIIDLLGGPGNIRSAYHCQTRLRFELADEARVQVEKLNATDGVATTRSSGGTFQVVIGTHVKDVFDALEPMLPGAGAGAATRDAGEAEPEKKRRNPLTALIDFIAGTFQPIVPALSGAGMIMALLAVLTTTNAISKTSQTYIVLAFMSNAVFYFLPVFVAISAADKLKTNRILAGVVAAMMLHPAWVQMVADKKDVKLFELVPVTLASYGSTVIPIILIIFVQAYFERWLDRVVPNAIKLVIVPMVVFLVMGVLAFTVLGPIGSVMGGWLASFFTFLTHSAPWAPPVIVGALLPVMVMFGVHNAIAPLGFAQLAQMRFDSIFGPGAICSNIAMGVASLVVAFRTKEKKVRQIATAGGITGLMGITEPALYGVALPKKYPLIAAMIGGGAGGLFAGLTSTHRFAVGTSGLPAVFLYIGDDTLRFFYQILISLAITAVVTAVVAFGLSFRFEKADPDQDAALGAGLELEPTAPVPVPVAAVAPGGAVATVVRTGLTEITSPVQGTVVPLDSVADAAFASGAMGPGVGIEPAGGTVVAPVSGRVVAAMGTGHAYGIRTDEGVEVLVHVGIDTVRMKGEGFSPAVAQGDRVEAGQLLVHADLDAIRDAGNEATVILVVTNAAKAGTVITSMDAGTVVAGEPVLAVTAHEN